MWMVCLFFCLVWIHGILGASVNQPGAETSTGYFQSCEMIVRRGGIKSNGVLVGWGGSLNQFKCQVICDPNPVAINPAIEWFRVKENGDQKNIRRFIGRVYAVRSTFNSISTLTITNFLERDAGEYICKAWLGDNIGWKEEHVSITYGCSSPRIICDVNRCIPKRYVCDGIKQCTDGYDEEYCGTDSTTEIWSPTSSPTVPIEEATTSTEQTTTTEESTTTTEEPTTTTPEEPTTTTEEPTSTTTKESTTTTEEPTTTTEEPTTTTEEPTTITEEPTTKTTEEPTTTTEEPTTTTQEPTTTTQESTTTTEEPTTTTKELTTTTQEGCNIDEFKCGDGECLPLSSQCNAFPDCTDGSDEENCKESIFCVESMTACLDNSGCYMKEQMCDGENDCSDGSDEMNCTTATSSAALVGVFVEEIVISEDSNECVEDAEFRCTDGTCIAIEWLCDSDEDCKDGLDELNCNRTKDGCLESEFVCDEGMCIPGYKVCDGVFDCPFSEDEENCGCNMDEFECGNGECLPLLSRCDQFPDCIDGSDEENCNGGETTPADPFEYDPYNYNDGYY